jgi:hypothetical protein
MTIVVAPNFREGVKDAVMNIEAVSGNWWKWTGVGIPKHCFIKWVNPTVVFYHIQCLQCLHWLSCRGDREKGGGAGAEKEEVDMGELNGT